MRIQTRRESSIDCLRMISMLMVVCLHFFSHGGLENAILPGSANWFVGNALLAACYVAVNCFVIISGYYLCSAKFKLKKIVGVWLQALVYSVGCYIVVSLTSGNFSLAELIKSGMVATMKQYWFVTAYLLLYIVFPFLNCAIAAMSRKMHFMCCAVLLAVFSVAHNIVYISDFGGVNGGYSFLWFCVLYIAAAYFRRYVPTERVDWKKPLAGYLICAALIAGERFAAHYITPYVFGRVALTSLFYSYNSILMTIASFSLFLCFRAIRIEGQKSNRLIALFSPLSFGVYLIHDNRYVRPMLWNTLEPVRFAQSPVLIPVVIVGAVMIFLGCCLIEWIRRKIFQMCKVNALVDEVCDTIQTKVTGWLET